MSDTNPPVGTCVNVEGLTWEFRATARVAHWAESISRVAAGFHHHCALNALWRLQQERDQLQISTNDLELHVTELLIVQGGLERRVIELQAEVEALRADKERLDWLEGLEYKGRGWVVRDSATGRGWRLHVSETRMGSHPSVRAAIDHARGAE